MSNESFIKQLAKAPPELRTALKYVPTKYSEAVSKDLEYFGKVVAQVNYYIEHMIGIREDHPRYGEIYTQRLGKALIQAYPDEN